MDPKKGIFFVWCWISGVVLKVVVCREEEERTMALYVFFSFVIHVLLFLFNQTPTLLIPPQSFICFTQEERKVNKKNQNCGASC